MSATRPGAGNDPDPRGPAEASAPAVPYLPVEPPLRDRLRWLWLVYLVFFLMGPILYAPAKYVALSFAGVAAFLPLYFWVARLEGPRALLPMAGMVALGFLFARHNPGASVFFIYAAAECARLGTRARTWAALGVLMAMVVAVYLTLQTNQFFVLPAVALIVVVGITNMHQREMARANREVRRSREEVEHLARIAERERIARDLHDLLGHTLSVVVMKSELAAKLAERDPARAVEEIRQVETVARKALSEVRAAVTSYRSDTLQGEIENARGVLRAAGVELEVDLDAMRLPPLHEGVLALALREAVTNVIRHAAASRCRVVLRADGEGARLIVEDDGRGPRGAEGSGLRGMRERVAGLGGVVDRLAVGLAGVGTRLAIHLPVPR